MSTASSISRRVPLDGRTYFWVAVGFLVFAVYGSWVPLQLRPISLAEALAEFSVVCARPVRVDSISDWAANVLLFVPIGFTLVAAYAVDRERWTALLMVPVVIPFCAAASTAIEFSQFFFPPRVSSLCDIVAQTIGTTIGVLMWLTAGQWLTERLREIWTSLGGQGSSARLLLPYLIFVAFVHWMPFDLTLSPGQLYHKYREGRVHFNPFDFGATPASAILIKQVWNLFYFVPVGVLLARLQSGFWRHSRNWGWVCLTGFVLAGSIQFGKLFVASRNCEASDVLVDILAVLGGWTITLRGWSPLGVERARQLGGTLDRRWLLAGWVGVLVLLNWLPFDFDWDVAQALHRLGGLSLVPFADYQEANPYQAFDLALQRTLIFAPLGALLASLTASRRRPEFIAVPLAAALALAIELGQAFLPDRYPSLTDALLETSGAWVGALVFVHVAGLVPRRATRREPAGEASQGLDGKALGFRRRNDPKGAARDRSRPDFEQLAGRMT